MPNVYNKLVLGALNDFRDVQKGAFWTTFSAERAPKEHDPECREASWSRPCFSRKHGNYCAVGTYCFFKVIRSMDFFFFRHAMFHLTLV